MESALSVCRLRRYTEQGGEDLYPSKRDIADTAHNVNSGYSVRRDKKENRYFHQHRRFLPFPRFNSSEMHLVFICLSLPVDWETRRGFFVNRKSRKFRKHLQYSTRLQFSPSLTDYGYHLHSVDYSKTQHTRYYLYGTALAVDINVLTFESAKAK